MTALAPFVYIQSGMDNTMNTTETHPMYQLTVAESAELEQMFNRLPKADREYLAATGHTMGWMTEAAREIIAWRGRE